jgi:3-hydroxyacyl-CoA dehydrogenase/enoyl-CoA hydratase/3-hydroxybutyryl-CoA epimerase
MKDKIMISYTCDSDGIATILWNVTNRPMNVMNDETITALEAAVDQAVADDNCKGVIMASAHKEYVVGADLSSVDAGGDADALYFWVRRIQEVLRKIETCGKPFAATINGHALGGGYELSMACHYRLAAAEGRFKIGLPEAKIGLLPGGGGTQRLPRMIGMQAAVMMMLEGKEQDQKTALSLGMIDKIVPTAELQSAAKEWLLTEGPKNAVKPWDKKGFKIPGGGPTSPAGAQLFVGGNAMLMKRTYGNFPAQKHIMSCVYEGLITDIDTGLKIEARYFAATAKTPEAKNLIRFFFAMTEANKLARRPEGYEKSEPKKIGMLGAGMMGAGIAYVSAAAGIDVVLIDQSQDAADKGKSYSEALVKKQVGRGRMTEEKGQALLDRITATTSYDGLSDVDLVIEAVFEDRKIKADVTQKAEAVMPAGAVTASNTSTLPITGLAEASRQADNFIGLHFFSPVDKMPLVEIIRGEKTSDECLAKAMDYVKAIRKTPIVVNDSRGFYTSRVFGTYVREGMCMLGEGINPALIENAGKMAGMPVGPLALVDEVSLELSHRISEQTRKDLGDKYIPTSADPMVKKMVEELGRMGKKVGKGFYDYPEKGDKRLWPGLAENFPQTEKQPDVLELIKRMMYVQSVETARCMEEGVVTNPNDADVGSIMGWGFAPNRGGSISQIDMVGVEEFVKECDRMAQAYGPRFTPPKLLRDMAAEGKGFFDKAA